MADVVVVEDVVDEVVEVVVKAVVFEVVIDDVVLVVVDELLCGFTIYILIRFDPPHI